jgi:WD40 repeat protein
MRHIGLLALKLFSQSQSTISAALVETLRTKRQVADLKFCYHFLKYSDQRRLDPVRILLSLAFVLAPQLPEFEKALLSLDVKKVLALRDMDSAFALLFEPSADLLASSGNILILVDALDEADAQGGTWRPMSNKAVQLIIGSLAKLPSNIRFFFTARPDTLYGNIESTLNRALKGPGSEGVLFLDPCELRRDQGGEGSRVLVYDSVVQECNLSSALPHLPHPTVDDLFRAYKMVFDRECPRGPVVDLLQVLMSAREPVSALLLSQLGLLDSFPLLPGSGCLFFMEEHKCFLLHKSLADWLLNKKLSQDHHIDVDKGNLLLGACLFHNEILAARDPELILSLIPGARVSGPGLRASDYAIKYGVHHLCQSLLSQDKPSFEQLDEALSSWEFVRQVFESGNGALLMRDLSQLSEVKPVSKCIEESLTWLRMNFNDFEREPSKIECLTLRSPLARVKYQQAVARLKPSWAASAVLGKVSQATWPQYTHIFKGHTNAILSVAYSPDGSYFATSGRDSTARIWDSTDGSCIGLLKGHTATIPSVVFSPDGKILATASEDGTARLWDLASGGIVSVLEGHLGPVGSVAFSPNRIHAATVAGHGGGDYTARLYDISTGECIFVIDDAYQCSSIFYSFDGKLLGASCGHAHVARVWDVTSLPAAVESVATFQHHSYVNYACFSPDAKQLASACSDWVTRVWDVSSSECVLQLKGHTENVVSVSFSLKGNLLCTGSWDTTVRLWDAASGDCISVLSGHTGYLGSIAFSPCGKRLATGSFDMRAMQWDLTHLGGPSSVLEGHTGVVASLSFSPCGSKLVTSSHDSKAKLWDVTQGSFITTLEVSLCL